MKNKQHLLISLTILFSFCICLIACNPTTQTPDNSAGILLSDEIKNVVIIIGDGMGFNHIKNAKTYYGIEKFGFEDNFVAPITTYSKSHTITDSAAAATALATGNKVNNSNVGRTDQKDLKNIMEIAKDNHKMTGIVTTDYLYGATPACFSSHADSRNDKEDIINGQAESGINLLIGQKHTKDLYSTDFRQKFENNGYNLISTPEELFEYDNSQKIVANLDGMRSKYNDDLSGQIDFESLINFTLNYLDNENGFCLMIEHAHIDKCSHNNDIKGSMCEMRAMADTIEQVYAFCRQRNDTAVIVTADHETGGLRLAENKHQLANNLYTTTNHTASDIPLYVMNAVIINVKEKLDNTFVFFICKKIVNNI